MSLVSLQNISISFGGPLLLDDATLHIEAGERICLVGRNGEGKSTLLNILLGTQQPDGGQIVLQNGVKIALLPQSVPTGDDTSVEDCIREAVDPHLEDWEADMAIDNVVELMGLENESRFNQLSGGQKRRALLARALVSEPDLLILDEPTNHLDIESIQWMEDFLLRYSGSILFVTHDRVFLRKLATRIVELDRGQLKSWNCGYDRFLELRDVDLAAEQKHNALFDKKLAQEEVWIRQGIKARRTRNEGRVRELEKLRGQRSQRREVSGKVRMQVQEGERSGRKVITATGLNHKWGELEVIKNLDLQIMRGDKIGIIGPNGCGKTTLIKLLLGQMEPQCGSIEHGTKLEISYFDQHRKELNDDATVVESVSGGNEFINFNGRSVHIFSYLQDFLFSPDRARCPIRVLSGGERNRLLLARLFTVPSNVLVLDEPTNDLDAETLDLLEELIIDYTGTILLVSHDRELLNHVASSTIVFEHGEINEYVGGYDDWQRQRKTPAPKAVAVKATPKPPAKTRKLNNKEREELKKLPLLIEKLEKEQEALSQEMANPDFFKSSPEDIKRAADRAAEIPLEHEAAFSRWEELDLMQ